MYQNTRLLFKICIWFPFIKHIVKGLTLFTPTLLPTSAILRQSPLPHSKVRLSSKLVKFKFRHYFLKTNNAKNYNLWVCFWEKTNLNIVNNLLDQFFEPFLEVSMISLFEEFLKFAFKLLSSLTVNIWTFIKWHGTYYGYYEPDKHIEATKLRMPKQGTP